MLFVVCCSCCHHCHSHCCVGLSLSNNSSSSSGFLIKFCATSCQTPRMALLLFMLLLLWSLSMVEDCCFSCFCSCLIVVLVLIALVVLVTNRHFYTSSTKTNSKFHLDEGPGSWCYNKMQIKIGVKTQTRDLVVGVIIKWQIKIGVER